jgi:hypothetical protein
MAAVTTVTPGVGGLVETIAITNQTANSTAVSKAVMVPGWARYATFVVKLVSMGGTTPLFDFTVKGHGGGVAVDDAAPNLFLLGAGWDGITQKTGATNSTTTIHIGPDVPTDDSGSATADDAYSVSAVLPPVLVYTYTTDGTTDDEDYSGTIAVFFRA